jgi:hypothetical protein
VQYIPAKRGASFYSQRVTLDGSDFIFEFSWNQRSGWYLALRDRQQLTLFSPRKIVVDWDLLEPLRYIEGCPQGSLIAVDLKQIGDKIGFEDLSSTSSAEGYDGRVALFYFTEDERRARDAAA